MINQWALRPYKTLNSPDDTGFRDRIEVSQRRRTEEAVFGYLGQIENLPDTKSGGQDRARGA